LQQLVAEKEVEAADVDDEIQPTAPRELNTSQLSSTLNGIEKHLQWIEDNDYKAERSRIALRGIRSHLEPYKQLLYERKKLEKQQKLDIYFKAVQKKEKEDNGPRPSAFGVTTFRPNNDYVLPSTSYP
jgi:hypothetical protein